MQHIISQLMTSYPSEDSAFERIFALRVARKQLACPGCGTLEVTSKPADRIVQFACACNKRIRLTSGTIFHGVRKPRAMLIAIELIDAGYAISSSQFHQIFGYAQSTAHMIQRKLSLQLFDLVPGCKVPVSALKPLFIRRSRLTAADTHPREDAASQMRETTNNDEPTESLKQNDDHAGAPHVIPTDEDLILRVLSRKPMHMDLICARTGLSDSQIVKPLLDLELRGAIKYGPQWCYSTTRTQSEDLLTEDVATARDNFIGMVRNLFHGVSFKYAELYGRLCTAVQMTAETRGERIWQALLTRGPVNSADVLAFVSSVAFDIPKTSMSQSES